MQGKPGERRKTKTRQDIIDATHEMILERGVEGVSLRAVADQIDYSPAAIYRYFSSKDELVDAVRAQCFERLNVALIEAVAGKQTAAEILLAGGMAYIRFAQAHPIDYHLMFHLAPSASTQADNQRIAMRALLMMVRLGIDSGAFSISEDYGEDAIVYHCWSTVHGLAMLQATVMQDEAVIAQVSEPILRRVIASFSTHL